jgi:glycosyltransferase 2 family protein
MSDRWRRGMTILTFLLMAAALGIVFHVLQQFTLAKVWASLSHIGPRSLGLAAFCTVASYLALTGFDWLGVAYAGGRVPYRRVALASFLSLSIGHTVGLAPFSSGAIRYRYYSEWGLDARQIGLVMLLSAVTVTLGEGGLTGFALLFKPDLAERVIAIGHGASFALGVLCLVGLALYVGLATFMRRPFRVWRWEMQLPDWRIALGQIGLGLFNFACVAGALHFLLSAVAPIDYGTTATAFVLGNLAALVTHVPGGLGVLEAVVVMVLPGIDAIGPLIAFRIVYYLVPLGIGGLLFGLAEIKQRRGPRAELRP